MSAFSNGSVRPGGLPDNDGCDGPDTAGVRNADAVPDLRPPFLRGYPGRCRPAGLRRVSDNAGHDNEGSGKNSGEGDPHHQLFLKSVEQRA